ncbi:PepSY domain-containing protein [Streptomyces radiopugnans]|uniref:Peptidase propeptide and YPEB domain-containing protein n=1 Tax=Streptomyces radiopugnans TaxID=403935 RepID=A0A1H9I8S6_9ACTN|nr:PepSY domain-containing protein [Streptomyces radiopugnans]SEQ70952.1 Peptidase propeptide and YPEB domain-containing protein [Streptomyces radiopugnans]
MNRKLVVAAVATAALAVGGGTLAFAEDDTDRSALAASLRAGADTDDRDDSRDDRSDDDRGERQTLRGAGITLQEAVAAALKAVPGTAESAELDDDDSDRLVWDVDVLGEDGAWHEVSVDADSADVLERGAGSDDGDDAEDDRDDDTDDRDDDAEDRGKADADDRDDDKGGDDRDDDRREG